MSPDRIALQYKRSVLPGLPAPSQSSKFTKLLLLVAGCALVCAVSFILTLSVIECGFVATCLAIIRLLNPPS
jgi:hypothetical protein